MGKKNKLGMGSPLGKLSGFGDGRGGLCGDGGGPARRSSPASERSRSARLRPGLERVYARAQGPREARARLKRNAEDLPRRGRDAGGGKAPVVWCSGTQGALRPTTSSAKGPERHGGSYRGLVVAGVAAQGRRRRGPAAALGGARGRGRRKASPGFWTSRQDSRRSCGANQGVSGARE